MNQDDKALIEKIGSLSFFISVPLIIVLNSKLGWFLAFVCGFIIELALIGVIFMFYKWVRRKK